MKKIEKDQQILISNKKSNSRVNYKRKMY